MPGGHCNYTGVNGEALSAGAGMLSGTGGDMYCVCCVGNSLGIKSTQTEIVTTTVTASV